MRSKYHCPKYNTTRRKANITEAHFLTECASHGSDFCFYMRYFIKYTVDAIRIWPV